MLKIRLSFAYGFALFGVKKTAVFNRGVCQLQNFYILALRQAASFSKSARLPPWETALLP